MKNNYENKVSWSSRTEVGANHVVQPMLRLRVPGRLPSWNALLAMHHWDRIKAKHQQQADFISALCLSVNASAIPTICRLSGCSTVFAIATLLRETSRTKSRLKSANAKQPKVRRKKQ